MKELNTIEALNAQDIKVSFTGSNQQIEAVKSAHLVVYKKEWVSIVGRSGSGKSALLHSLLGLSRGAYFGRVTYNLNDGRSIVMDLSKAKSAEHSFKKVRGKVAVLTLQNGSAALNPLLSIRRQVESFSNVERFESLLSDVGLVQTGRVLDSYPHQLSGGMAQRVMLAAALVCQPEYFFLDEVTSGLDVVLQLEILDLIQKISQKYGIAGVFVTHYLSHALSFCSRIYSMENGQISDAVKVDEISSSDGLMALAKKNHPRTICSVRHNSSTEPVESLYKQVVVSCSNVSKSKYDPQKKESSLVLSGIDFLLQQGQITAFVGRSGAGKTTLIRLLVGLELADQGYISLFGQDISSLSRSSIRALRRRVSVLYQSPYLSLNPGYTALDSVKEVLRGGSKRKEEAFALLERVGLMHRAKSLLGQMSGGERRRLGVVRALFSGADLIVLDEPTAGLDAENRHLVTELIHSLMLEKTNSCVVIVSHDFTVVRSVAHQLIVLHEGKIVEKLMLSGGELQSSHPYTHSLWMAAKSIDDRLLM